MEIMVRDCEGQGQQWTADLSGVQSVDSEHLIMSEEKGIINFPGMTNPFTSGANLIWLQVIAWDPVVGKNPMNVTDLNVYHY